ncbi:hypothetical protein [Spirosoma fluminis]
METQTANPYCLAQYVIPNPVDRKKQANEYDADPILQRLPEHLLEFIKNVFDDKADLAQFVDKYPHPNSFFLALCKEADQFCPGRSTSDLLAKQLICERMFHSFGKALKTIVAKELGGSLILEILLSKLRR